MVIYTYQLIAINVIPTSGSIIVVVTLEYSAQDTVSSEDALQSLEQHLETGGINVTASGVTFSADPEYFSYSANAGRFI